MTQLSVVSSRLKALLSWAEQATAGSESNLKSVAKRALANTNAIAIAIANANANAYVNAYAIAIANAIANVLANVNAIANVLANVNALANANALANVRNLEELKIFKDINFTVLIARLEALKAKIPDEKQPPEVHQAFAKRFVQTWVNALHLSSELIDLSEQEAKAWESYFYANWLIVQCKQAAVRVSPKTWEAIEERMLLVPNN